MIIGSINATIKITSSISGQMRSRFWPYTESVTFPVVVRSSINAIHGIGANVSVGVQVVTGSNPTGLLAFQQNADSSALTVNDSRSYRTGQYITISDAIGSESAVVISVVNKTIVTRKISRVFTNGAIVFGSGGFAATTLPSNGRLCTISSNVIVRPNIAGMSKPFQPGIEKKIIVTCTATGVSTIPPVTIYSFAPPIRVYPFIRGVIKPFTYVSINKQIEVNFAALGTTKPISGDITSTVVVSMTGSGVGYTLKGRLASTIKVNSNIVGSQRVAGFVSKSIKVSASIGATATWVNSLYGRIRPSCIATAVYGTQQGQINSVINIAPMARGQAVDPRTVYGAIISNVRIGSNVRSYVAPVIRSLKPIVIPVITGRTEIVSGVSTAVFRAIEARSYLSPGVPVPNNFYYGSISGLGPVAQTTLSIGGSAGDLTILVDGTPISAIVPSNTNVLSLIAATVDAINSTNNFSARSQGTDITILAPKGSGAQNNNSIVTFVTNGSRTINGLTSGIVARMSGGNNGNVIIRANGIMVANDGKITGLLVGLVNITPNIQGSVRAVSGSISQQITITCRAYETSNGANIAKSNVYVAVSSPDVGITIPKVSTSVVTGPIANAQHVAKTTVYVVLGPDDTSGDSYSGIFFT